MTRTNISTDGTVTTVSTLSLCRVAALVRFNPEELEAGAKDLQVEVMTPCCKKPATRFNDIGEPLEEPVCTLCGETAPEYCTRKGLDALEEANLDMGCPDAVNCAYHTWATLMVEVEDVTGYVDEVELDFLAEVEAAN